MHYLEQLGSHEEKWAGTLMAITRAKYMGFSIHRHLHISIYVLFAVYSSGRDIYHIGLEFEREKNSNTSKVLIFPSSRPHSFGFPI